MGTRYGIAKRPIACWYRQRHKIDGPRVPPSCVQTILSDIPTSSSRGPFVQSHALCRGPGNYSYNKSIACDKSITQ